MVPTNSSSYQCDQTRKVLVLFTLFALFLFCSSSEGLRPRQQEGLQPPQATPPDMHVRSVLIYRRIDSRPAVHEPNATAGPVGIRTARSSLNLFLWPDVLLIGQSAPQTRARLPSAPRTIAREPACRKRDTTHLHVVEVFTNQW